MEIMEMVLLSREFIKPSSPTPSHLRIYPLSFIDNIFYRKYVPALFFYSPNDKCNNQNSKISQLRQSLSQLLSKYYPFAGKLKDKTNIECNDQGVLFLVTKIKKKLSEILQNPTKTLLNPLFPDELQWKDMDWSETLIVIQINSFACGGIAISICMTHKIGDGATLFNFMNDWAIFNQKVERGEEVEEEEEEEEGLLALPVPLLGEGASIFPQRDLPIFPEIEPSKGNKMVYKRFVFQASMIKSLKAMVTNSKNSSPTRVQVITALIYKRAVSTMGLNFTNVLLSTVVDLRKRMVPPLSKRCVGNMIWFLTVHINKKEIELPDLVCEIKQGLSEFCEVYAKFFFERGKNNLLFISECLKHVNVPCSENQTMLIFSSWCGFPIYEVDFGWGKPAWVTTFGCSLRNFIFMMDTRDGNGIEAFVNMEKSDMARFEHDEELLKYASLNPSNVGHDS